MTKYGTIMDIKEISERLKQARINAGVIHGYTYKSGIPKPMTQVQAAKEIGISKRKLEDVEGQRANFKNVFAEKRAISFIKRYKA